MIVYYSHTDKSKVEAVEKKCFDWKKKNTDANIERWSNVIEHKDGGNYAISLPEEWKKILTKTEKENVTEGKLQDNWFHAPML